MKDWQPSIRIIKNPITTDSKPSGVKAVPEPVPKNKPRPEARHLRPATTGHWEFRSTLKQVEFDGVNAKDQKSGHYSFEKGLGMKLRASGLRQMRNGIGISTCGDKPYGNPEYSTNFYKLDGVVSGQNICQRPKTQSLIGATDFHDLRSYANINPDRTLWKDRVRNDRRNSEIADVEALPDN